MTAIFLTTSSANSITFGQYILFAAGNENPTNWQTRGIGIAALTFSCLLHAIFPRMGVRLVNLLGIFKSILMLVIIFSGFAALGGHLKIPKPDNFSNAFANSSTSPYNYVIALNSVIYSFMGWSYANFVRSDMEYKLIINRLFRNLKILKRLLYELLQLQYLLLLLCIFLLMSLILRLFHDRNYYLLVLLLLDYSSGMSLVNLQLSMYYLSWLL
jgi:Amino acid permease